jgi:putative oxidoreductase
MATLTQYSDARPLDAIDEPRTRGLARAIVLWTLQIGTAGMFLMAGVLKLSGTPVMVQLFDVIGFGQWFRYLTGAIEVIAGLLLLVPSLAFFGAAVLTVTMVGAVITHLFVVGGSAAPAAVLLALTATVAWMRRPR